MFEVQREIDRDLLKMANNNISGSSTPSLPTFVPRIVMLATYTQQTQMPIIISTSSLVQADTQTLNNTSTQTKTIWARQNSPPQNSRAVQTDHMLNDTLPIESTDSSTSTDISDKAVVSINQPNSNRKRHTKKIIVLITDLPENKERK